jgi:penicillin-binding protein 1A
VLSERLAALTTGQMQTVVSYGTGKRADYGGFAAGKTGTTEDYGDAWFVGFTRELTIAVWVGYPDKLVPMKTEFDGEPVAGGTFPAQIWHDFVVQAKAIFRQRIAEREALRTGQAAPQGEDPAAQLDGNGDTTSQQDGAAGQDTTTPDQGTGGGQDTGTPQKDTGGGTQQPSTPQDKPKTPPSTGTGGTDAGGISAPD